MNKRRLIIVIILAVVSACAGVLLPGVVMNANVKAKEEKAIIVPEEYYSASNMAIAQNASARLTSKEKYALCVGEWDAIISECGANETTTDPFEMAKLGKDKLMMLDEDAREELSGYSNWYKYETKPYKAVDITFNTYTAFFWEIRYERYDHERLYRIMMTEDGQIFYAEKVDSEGTDVYIDERIN